MMIDRCYSFTVNPDGLAFLSRYFREEDRIIVTPFKGNVFNVILYRREHESDKIEFSSDHLNKGNNNVYNI